MTGKHYGDCNRLINTTLSDTHTRREGKMNKMNIRPREEEAKHTHTNQQNSED